MEEPIEQTGRVLVVDDDRSIRQLLCNIVEHEGLTVDCVSDGSAAIEKLQQRSYAVILLDLMMPRFDGFSVLDWLKANAPRHKPIILLITAYPDQRYKPIDSTIVAGVIRKPFDIPELGSVVRLCVKGFTDELATLTASRTRSLHELARKSVSLGISRSSKRGHDGDGAGN